MPTKFTHTIRIERPTSNVRLPGTPNMGLGGVNAIGAILNCPIIAVFPG
jgi:hypothetical protein